MAVVTTLESGRLFLRVSTTGGLILGFWQSDENGKIDLLRPSKSDAAGALDSSCYPLVPFGNRVKDNAFSFEGSEYRLSPNTDWDKHYLHGEGWQADWEIIGQTGSSIEMAFVHEGDGTPYRYTAKQGFDIDRNVLTMTLSVENRGEKPLPFGLGWHPYFPLTPATTLMAPSRGFWTEVADWLPGERIATPPDLDFSAPAPLPHRWVNNGFEGWSGEALVTWPERHTALHLTADPIFKHAFVFVSDTKFDPGFKRDYFCFEPMTHLPNGHNLSGLGDLKVLKPGERLSGSVRLRPTKI